MRTGLFIAVAALAIIADASHAADLHDPNNTFSDLLQLVRDNASLWSDRLRSFALQIFWWLAGIQLALTLGPWVARGESAPTLLTELTLFIFKTVVFYSLMIHSVTFGEAIVNSFRHAGATAAGVPVEITPGDMFTMAVSFADTVSDVDTYKPGPAIMIMFSALVVLVCFTFLATLMAVTLMESYFVINAAKFFMGFGGAQFTRDYATAMYKYAVAVGAKLFVITLIVGLIRTCATDWQVSYRHDSTSTWTLVGLSFMCALFAKTIMDRVESLIIGVSPGGGAVLGGMAAAGMAFGTAAMAAVSAKMAAANMVGGSSSGGGVGNVISSLSGGGYPASSAMTSGGGSSSGTPPRSSAQSSSPSSGGVGARQKIAGAAHAAASGAVRTSGFINSIAVPGMEGSEHASLGSSPHLTPPSPEPVSDTPENVIKPEDDGDKA